MEITFDFGRQGGMASNQFAVWIADAEGGMVKTVAVTNFTARRGGWKSRKESLPQWVADSGVAAMEQAEIDAVSRATPGSREVCYAWYRDDASGRPVPPGKYTVNVEASLRWENRVLYKAEIDLGGEGAKARPAAEFVGSSTAERGMLTNVVVRSIP
ncbi:MAG: DUF2271 domain-containing protein [Planctomycetota bacterium]|nr:DUF2271 domain-containing protein [Planctomycetota bacterium]